MLLLLMDERLKGPLMSRMLSAEQLLSSEANRRDISTDIWCANTALVKEWFSGWWRLTWTSLLGHVTAWIFSSTTLIASGCFLTQPDFHENFTYPRGKKKALASFSFYGFLVTCHCWMPKKMKGPACKISNKAFHPLHSLAVRMGSIRGSISANQP